jgi:hypothetical protein
MTVRLVYVCLDVISSCDCVAMMIEIRGHQGEERRALLLEQSPSPGCISRYCRRCWLCEADQRSCLLVKKRGGTSGKSGWGVQFSRCLHRLSKPHLFCHPLRENSPVDDEGLPRRLSTRRNVNGCIIYISHRHIYGYPHARDYMKAGSDASLKPVTTGQS